MPSQQLCMFETNCLSSTDPTCYWANDMADTSAKSAVESHRVPLEIRRQVKAATNRAALDRAATARAAHAGRRRWSWRRSRCPSRTRSRRVRQKPTGRGLLLRRMCRLHAGEPLSVRFWSPPFDPHAYRFQLQSS